MVFQIMAVGKRWDVVSERKYVAGTPNQPTIHFTLSNGLSKCRFHWVIATDEWLDDMNGHLAIHTTIACRYNLMKYFYKHKADFDL